MCDYVDVLCRCRLLLLWHTCSFHNAQKSKMAAISGIGCKNFVISSINPCLQCFMSQKRQISTSRKVILSHWYNIYHERKKHVKGRDTFTLKVECINFASGWGIVNKSPLNYFFCSITMNHHLNKSYLLGETIICKDSNL